MILKLTVRVKILEVTAWCTYERGTIQNSIHYVYAFERLVPHIFQILSSLLFSVEVLIPLLLQAAHHLHTQALDLLNSAYSMYSV